MKTARRTKAEIGNLVRVIFSLGYVLPFSREPKSPCILQFEPDRAELFQLIDFGAASQGSFVIRSAWMQVC